jgi:ribonuclease Y
MIFLYILLGAVLGIAAGYLIRQSLAAKRIGTAESKAEKILDEAKQKHTEMLLEAKTRSLELIEQAKKQEADFRGQIVRFEERIDRREKELEQKSGQLDRQRTELEHKSAQIKEIQEEIQNLRAKQIANLEKIAQMTREEAAKVLLDNAERTVKDEMVQLHKKLLEQARESADRDAREIVAQAIEDGIPG